MNLSRSQYFINYIISMLFHYNSIDLMNPIRTRYECMQHTWATHFTHWGSFPGPQNYTQWVSLL